MSLVARDRGGIGRAATLFLVPAAGKVLVLLTDVLRRPLHRLSS